MLVQPFLHSQGARVAGHFHVADSLVSFDFSGGKDSGSIRPVALPAYVPVLRRIDNGFLQLRLPRIAHAAGFAFHGGMVAWGAA